MFVRWSLLHGLVGLVLDEQLPHEVLRTIPTERLVSTAIRVLREGILPVRTAAVARARPR